MTIHVRSAVGSDADAVDAMLTAYSEARGVRLPGAGAAGRIARTDATTVVVEDAGRVVGFGTSWPHRDGVRCFARVHPDDVGCGVSTLMLDHLEAAAAAAGAARFDVMQPQADPAAEPMLIARGYGVLRHVLRMEMELVAGYQSSKSSLPLDVTLRRFDEKCDDDALFAAYQAANPEETTSAGEWWSEMREDPSMPYDPTLWHVVVAGDEVVGYALGSRHVLTGRTVGYVAEVGVRPEWRGRGLAYAALTAVIDGFAEAGLPAATLNVDADNLHGAIRLYRKAGMMPIPVLTEWSKPLR